MASYLPSNPSGGLLPYWLLLLGGASLYNAGQSYLVQWQSKEVYGRKPEEVTALASRLFGTWTLLTSVIRLRAAYNIGDATHYDFCHFTFEVAALHFLLEFFVFGTVKINRASVWPLVGGVSSTIWMWLQRGHYLGL